MGPKRRPAPAVALHDALAALPSGPDRLPCRRLLAFVLFAVDDQAHCRASLLVCSVHTLD
eukprot:6208402-Pleurochrysis_carterae.AAC.1